MMATAKQLTPIEDFDSPKRSRASHQFAVSQRQNIAGQSEEAALVLAAKTGDGHAFEILFKRYQRKIMAVARRFTGTREDTEDIVQQSFQKAFVHLHRFEGKSSFSTWLTRIAINEALMLLRRGRVLREVSINDLSGDEEISLRLEIPDSRAGPEVAFLQRELSRILSAAMDKLTPRTRTAIQLRELHELSMEDAARVIPAVKALHDAIAAKVEEWKDIVKIGRTHMQDATPLTLGQEWSGYEGMLADDLDRIEDALKGIYRLALGGTAVGTGINSAPGFAEAAAAEIAKLTGLPFATAPNKFTVQGAHDAQIQLSGTLRTLAVATRSA
jgi:RNA polymerase sigma factor (sigma-70 family)